MCVYPMRNGSLYGYIDVYGNWRVRPMFSAADAFHEGLAAVKVDEKWGYINESGELVIPPKYEMALRFHFGLAPIQIDGKMSFISRDGKMKMRPVLSYIGEFREGLATASVRDKWGFIDSRGSWVIDPQYEHTSCYSHGLARIVLDRKICFIDMRGNVVIPAKYMNSGLCYSMGYCNVSHDDTRWHYIDAHGKSATGRQYSSAGSFTDGLAAVQTRGRWRFIDYAGNTILSMPTYVRKLRNIVNGRAVFQCSDTRYGVIDINGNVVVKPLYASIVVYPHCFICTHRSGRSRAIDCYGKSIAITESD